MAEALNPIRAAARSRRAFLDGGGQYTIEEARAQCVTMREALLAFDATEDQADGIRITCCGAPARITSGILGAKVECPRCGAKAVDATSPLWSPFLPRESGSVRVYIPSKEWVDAFGERCWFVMHEGNR